MQALVQSLGPFGAVLVLAAYAVWSKPKPVIPVSNASYEYAQEMIAATIKVAHALESIADKSDKIERHMTIIVERNRK